MDSRTLRLFFPAVLLIGCAIGAFFFLNRQAEQTTGREAELERQLQETRGKLEETREQLEQARKRQAAVEAALRAEKSPNVPNLPPAAEASAAKKVPGTPSVEPVSGRVVAVTPTDQLCVVSWTGENAPRANQLLQVLRGDKVVGKLKLTGAIRRREQAVADIIPDSFKANDFPRPGDLYQTVPE